LLEAVGRRCAVALPWMATCHQTHSALYCGKRVLESQTGVQRGDPCGPAGFAWGIHDVVEAVDGLVEWQCCHHDDGTLVGYTAQFRAAYKKIRETARARGVELNAAKCKLWGPAFMQGRGTVVEFGLDDVLRGVPVVSYLPGTGLRTLGVPVCHPVGAEFASQVWGESVAEVRRLLSLLELLPQSHIQYTLLRACMDACRVNDLLRGSSLRDGEDAVRGMSALLWSTLGVVVGAPVLGAQWSQASLPVRCGVLVDIQPLVEWAGNLTAMLEAGQKYSSQRWGG